jgi:hypothetical protein
MGYKYTYNEEDIRSATSIGFIVGILAGFTFAVGGFAIFLYSQGLLH